jgi:hypothetical protein
VLRDLGPQLGHQGAHRMFVTKRRWWSIWPWAFSSPDRPKLLCSTHWRRADLEPVRGLPCEHLLKKTTSRAAMAPAAKLGDSQWMFFMDFS